MGEIIYRADSPIRVLPYNVTRRILRADTLDEVSVFRAHNQILDTGLQVILDRLRGVGPALTTFALGTGATPPSADGTGPEGEVWRSDLSLLTRVGPILEAQYYLASNMCNGQSLQSAMILAEDIPFSWVSFPAETKTQDFVWVFQWSFPIEAVV
jgi:hypothetical protein